MDYHGFIARKTKLFRPFLDVHQLVSHFEAIQQTRMQTIAGLGIAFYQKFSPS
jgi:hypothetical protein